MSCVKSQRLKKIKNYVINRDGKICCYCDKILSDIDITMEHIVPYSRRGTFNTTNLTVACANCNNSRGNQSFFEFCKKYNFSDEKTSKYKKLYFNNLKIKILNIAKEECLTADYAVPNDLITKVCDDILKIKKIDFTNYECHFNNDMKFNLSYDRKKIKFYFEKLIKIIESNSI